MLFKSTIFSLFFLIFAACMQAELALLYLQVLYFHQHTFLEDSVMVSFVFATIAVCWEAGIVYSRLSEFDVVSLKMTAE